MSSSELLVSRDCFYLRPDGCAALWAMGPGINLDRLNTSVRGSLIVCGRLGAWNRLGVLNSDQSALQCEWKLNRGRRLCAQ